MKIRAEISEIETNKIIENSSKTKIWFFEKKNKIDTLQLDSPSKKREDSNDYEMKVELLLFIL